MFDESLGRVAVYLADRIADLLEAPVRVMDGHGDVLCEAEPSTAASDLQDPGGYFSSPYLTVNVSLHQNPVQVVIGAPRSAQPVSKSVASSLVDLVVKQHLSRTEIENQYDARNSFVQNLLAGSFPDERTATRQARRLGIDLRRDRAVLVLDSASRYLSPDSKGRASKGEHLRWRTQNVLGAIGAYFRTGGDAICGHMSDGRIAILKGCGRGDLMQWISKSDLHRQSDNRTLQRALEAACTGLLTYLAEQLGMTFHIAIGRPYFGLRGLTNSYADAVMALDVGRELNSTDGINTLERLGVEAFLWLSEPRLKVEFAAQLLRPLDGQSELYETLRQFFESNFSPATAAQKLNLHRNSLYYRLDKITELVGLDPRITSEALQLQLAIQICNSGERKVPKLSVV